MVLFSSLKLPFFWICSPFGGGGGFFRLAFRNVFRHFWRNMLVIFSVKVVLVVLLLVQSQKKGTHSHIIQKNIIASTGIAQIFPKNQEKTLFYKDFLEKNRAFFPKNTAFVPRITQWAWGNAGKSQKPIQIIGISQADEKNFDGIFSKIDFLEGKNAFLGEKFKEKNAKINDTLWINTQEKTDFYIIKGFFAFPNPVLNENAIIIPLHHAQKLYNLENQCSFLSVTTQEKAEFSNNFIQNTKKNLQNSAKLLTWQESMPDIAQMLWLDKVGFLVLMTILCLVLALGLVGSVIILAQERKKEFLQLYELGVSKDFLVKWILSEWFLLLFFGIFGGILILLPVLYYFSNNPIILQGDIAQSLREIGFSAEIHFAFDVQIFFFPLCILVFLGVLLGMILRKLVV